MMKKINILIYILVFFLFGCKNQKYSDSDYLRDNPADTLNVNDFNLGGEVFTANNKTIDSLVNDLNIKGSMVFSIDVYPFQSGPEYDTLGNKLTINIDSQYWELGPLFSIETLKSLEFHSICAYNFNIKKENTNLEKLHIGSHSCDFVKSKNPSKYSFLKGLRHISFHRIELLNSDFQELSKVNNLSSFIANDCILDLKDLLLLKSQLKYLDLTNSRIDNIHLISEFSNLEVIYIGATNNYDKKSIDANWFLNIKNLKGLSIKRTKITNYASLSKLKNIQRLFISQKDLKNIPSDIIENSNIEIVYLND